MHAVEGPCLGGGYVAGRAGNVGLPHRSREGARDKNSEATARLGFKLLGNMHCTAILAALGMMIALQCLHPASSCTSAHGNDSGSPTSRGAPSPCILSVRVVVTSAVSAKAAKPCRCPCRRFLRWHGRSSRRRRHTRCSVLQRRWQLRCWRGDGLLRRLRWSWHWRCAFLHLLLRRRAARHCSRRRRRRRRRRAEAVARVCARSRPDGGSDPGRWPCGAPHWCRRHRLWRASLLPGRKQLLHGHAALAKPWCARGLVGEDLHSASCFPSDPCLVLAGSQLQHDQGWVRGVHRADPSHVRSRRCDDQQHTCL